LGLFSGTNTTIANHCSALFHASAELYMLLFTAGTDVSRREFSATMYVHYFGCDTQVNVVRSAPRSAAPAHHIMKEVNPILTENLRLGKPMLNGLQYDSQQSGLSLTPAQLLYRFHTFLDQELISYRYSSCCSCSILFNKNGV